MYVKQGIGAFWDKALQFATEAGAAITGATAGQKWGDVVKTVGGSFNQAVFGAQPPQAPQAPAPQPSYAPSQPAYVPPRPAFSPAPPPRLVAGPPMYMPAPGGFGTGHGEEKRTNWLLYGGLGAGAIVLYLLLRKPQPGGAR